MALNTARVVDDIVQRFDNDFGFPEDFDDTRLRQSFGHIVDAIYDEIKANMVVTVNLSDTSVEVSDGTDTYNGNVENGESVGSVE